MSGMERTGDRKRDERRLVALLAAVSDLIRQETATFAPEFAERGTWGDVELLGRLVFEFDGIARPSQLVGLAYTTSAGVTGSLRRLEAEGLVERERVEDDRRVLLVRVTDSGRERIKAGIPAFDDFVERRVGYLSDDDFDCLYDFIQRQFEM